jgi:MOSC domain-containing protein YiiM
MIHNVVGKVLSLYISKENSPKRISKEKLGLTIGGVVGDKFFNKDKDREVLVASIDSYELAKQNDMEVPSSALGENILIDYNPYELAIGQKIQIGTAVLEISLYCPICNHLSRVKKGLPKLLKEDRGIFARVIISGEVKLGDRVILL